MLEGVGDINCFIVQCKWVREINFAVVRVIGFSGKVQLNDYLYNRYEKLSDTCGYAEACNV